MSAVRSRHQVPNVGVRRMARHLIANQYNAGSSPVTHSNSNTTLAHLVEHRREESGVLGSSPRGCTKSCYLRKVLSGGMLRLGRSGEGSNPSMETKFVKEIIMGAIVVILIMVILYYIIRKM